ncbi:hypothetical protein K461DRAFT_232317 [Myriangium duriaei CBS 260.36]|uniref:Uncharacterized protein n=1 Tax=Myriangium duriaei CBS 260.36 TaxID=1168546 RepID=A0A9P4MD31_9PEZI|nr:hypothetical protein K461DRAFT_232317 [Myriangium duriaei CBS 260.36]
MPAGTSLRVVFSLIRNLALAALLYTALYGTVQLASNPSSRARARQKLPAVLGKLAPQESKHDQLKISFEGAHRIVSINPHANVFNRPPSAVEPKDDFYGKRPHVDTVADLNMLVEECRGTYDGLEKMRNVFECLKFLAEREDKYYSLPDLPQRASEQDPTKAEYLDADGQGNTLSKYPSIKSAHTASKSGLGSCPGPIIPYHVYWAGPATWRLEIFVKAYLYTQNLPCSRLYLWLDADKSPTAVEKMLTSDPLFARFLPFVERGDLKVMAWKFPTRIPLPPDMDHTDGIGYYTTPGKPNAKGESQVADGIISDANGQQWLTLTPKQMTFFPQAISDAVRFVILHQYGGVYMDMDVLMLRDFRPLLLPEQHAFAERWAAHPHPGDYNTAIMSLTANSSLSSYLLRGGVRMATNFHPRVIGRMAWKDGRDREFLMLETAAFDPIWTEFNWDREGRCTVPCLRDYGAVFKGKPGSIKDEWESYDDEPLPLIDLRKTPSFLDRLREKLSHPLSSRSIQTHGGSQDSLDISTMDEPLSSFAATPAELEALSKTGAVKDYIVEEDKYPPSNRTLQNFFRGAWTYHIHNQWLKHPEPSSWFAIMQSAHDGFFAGSRTNPYGEKWSGPHLAPYNHWTETV